MRSQIIIMIIIKSAFTMFAWQRLFVSLLVIAASRPTAGRTQALDSIRPKLELKFQTELDNSTVIKQLEQQQVFKCQVRLAPAGSGALAAARPRFKWSSGPVESGEDSGEHLGAPSWPGDEPLNISRLSLEWLRNERPLIGDQLEPVGVINVTLRGQAQPRFTDGETASQPAKQLKTKRPRIEIKNTLNGAQLKLTSRLRVARLKPSDGGEYKCVARATLRQRQTNSPTVVQVNESLESNATLLVVVPTTGTDSSRQHQSSGVRKKWTSTSDATTRQWPAPGGPLNSASSGAEEMKHGAIQGPTNQLNSLADASSPRAGHPSGWNLLEDDEDLFRLEPGELINGQQPSLAGGADEENNDNTSSQHQMIEFSDNGELSPDSSQQDVRSIWASNEPQDVYLDRILQQQQQQQQPYEPAGTNGEGEWPPVTLGVDNDEVRARKSKQTNTNDRQATRHHNQVSSFLQSQLSQKAAANPPFGTKQHLAKLVHRIAPELGCYTGVGEFYHGSISSATDQRPCLNWLHVSLALAASLKEKSFNRTGANLDWGALTMYASRADNHNSCRNPNSDPTGPWCFVAYSEQLDGAPREPMTVPTARSTATQLAASRPIKITTQKQRHVWLGTNKQSFVVRPCAIGSCSEYLWLYVVAPPLGLLVLLTCLVSLLVRAIRRSHYNAIFSAAYQRHTNRGPTLAHSPGLLARRLGKVFRSRACCFPAGAKHVKSSPCAKKPNYLDDDIFEIVDDIDWSEGQAPSSANSMSSPKSKESFKLNASGCTSQRNEKANSTLSHSKSINPMLSSDRPPLTSNDAHSPAPPPTRPLRLASSNMSKSKSQAGPMFATLRCHVRNTQLQQQQRLAADTNNRCSQEKKSSSFIDNADLPSNNNTHWLSPSIGSNLSSLQTDNSQSSGVKTGRLISCSSSTNSSGSPLAGNKQDACDKLTLVSELPRLAPTSVNVTHETQPLYEGKYSQVQWAYLKQQDNDATQATGRIGSQVAVHALKQQAALDETLFAANNLRLRNLNHLNVIKVIGYVQYENADALKSNACAIVYDMAHLMDLGDWLKEQSKEAVIGQNSELVGDLSLRQNLACLAKQIALAVDYLHDKQLVYKDLACRNCFLDVTRMLVKLATFNVEPEFECSAAQTSGEYDLPQVEQHVSSQTKNSLEPNEELKKRVNLKSMVRPKYLLDYYVIDSRPSECQLLPLSWIPLESILFNKFNRQTDIWSYGCLLYELFSLGEVAYFGYSSKQVIDAVRSNMMPPQPLLCPNGIYKLMCKCLSDIPTLRPNIKHIYEQLNLYSGQCSSFLNHHLCII